MPVEVKIGVQNAARELTVDVDKSADEVSELVVEALSSDSAVLQLEDTRGRRVIVPSAKLAYVEVSTGVTGTVGFRS